MEYIGEKDIAEAHQNPADLCAYHSKAGANDTPLHYHWIPKADRYDCRYQLSPKTGFGEFGRSKRGA